MIGLAIPLPSQPPLPTLAEFHRDCANHDWEYEYSDDYWAWSDGNLEQWRLSGIAARSAPHAALWRDWLDYKAGKGPKPQVPAEVAA